MQREIEEKAMAIKRRTRFFVKIVMAVLMSVSMSVLAMAESGYEDFTGFQRGVGFTLSGGYTQTESFGSVPELTAEFQFQIAPRIYASVSVGYLGETIANHSRGMMGGAPMGFEDHLHRFQVIPIMMNVYYSVPFGPKAAAYLTAGAGYFAATYWDINTQSQGDFGGHAGAGLNFRPSRRMEFFTAGTYRLARVDGFLEETHPGSVPGIASPSSFNFSLNGFRLQFGMRFRY
jgi:opacity protein-like surface antigen